MNRPNSNHLMTVTDLPRDKQGALGGLRRALVASFNYCRKYPTKMVVLKSTLEYVHGRIRAWEVTQEELAAAIEARLVVIAEDDTDEQS
jgi:hypothetical protein